jgi:hypothetical protein
MSAKYPQDEVISWLEDIAKGSYHPTADNEGMAKAAIEYLKASLALEGDNA